MTQQKITQKNKTTKTDTNKTFSIIIDSPWLLLKCHPTSSQPPNRPNRHLRNACVPSAFPALPLPKPYPGARGSNSTPGGGKGRLRHKSPKTKVELKSIHI